MRGGKVSMVFYSESYHPIQAGSIDGTDILPHDSAVYRALLCANAGLYDPHGDPKVIGDPYCTLFVGRLSPFTTEESLRKAMNAYGRVTNMRLVRHIVTGASRRYAFVEYETDRELRRAYESLVYEGQPMQGVLIDFDNLPKYAHHSVIDGSKIIVDYNRQQLMPGWIPRRLGGGVGGEKESGQLRFGGRDRPFQAPLSEIPYDDLKRLGIPPPPEGRYMTRYQVPSPPRRKSSQRSREDSPHRHRRSEDREEHHSRRRRSADRDDSAHRDHKNREDSPHRQQSRDGEDLHSRRRKRSRDRDDSSYRDRHPRIEYAHRHKRRSTSRDYSS